MSTRSTTPQKHSRTSFGPQRTLASSAVQRTPSVQRVPSAFDTLKRAAAQTFDDGQRGLRESARKAPTAILRFGKFFRAYVRAFSVGLGVFFILNEVTSGHFNPLAAIATHLGLILAAPLYAILMSPAIYALYLKTALLPIDNAYRAYVVACLPGALLLVSPLIQHNVSTRALPNVLLGSLSFFVAGLVAARTFNGGIARIK